MAPPTANTPLSTRVMALVQVIYIFIYIDLMSKKRLTYILDTSIRLVCRSRTYTSRYFNVSSYSRFIPFKYIII